MTSGVNLNPSMVPRRYETSSFPRCRGGVDNGSGPVHVGKEGQRRRLRENSRDIQMETEDTRETQTRVGKENDPGPRDRVPSLLGYLDIYLSAYKLTHLPGNFPSRGRKK